MLPLIIAYHDVPIPNFYNEWIAGLLGLLALWHLISKQFWHCLLLMLSWC